MPYIVSFLVHSSRLRFIVLILLVIMGESSSMGYRLPDGVGVGTYLVEVLPRPEFTHPSRINSSAATT